MLHRIRRLMDCRKVLAPAARRRAIAPAGRPRLSSALLAWTIASVLASCSGGESPYAEDRTGSYVADDLSGNKSSRYPPGAAAALSMTGATALPAGSPFETAVNCAAAIRVTGQMISSMSAGAAEAGKTLQQAEALYLRKAKAVEKDGSRKQQEASAAIENKVQQVQDAPRAQAQLAVTCLRNLNSEA